LDEASQPIARRTNVSGQCEVRAVAISATCLLSLRLPTS
jgi:hypothetical protein